MDAIVKYIIGQIKIGKMTIEEVPDKYKQSVIDAMKNN